MKRLVHFLIHNIDYLTAGMWLLVFFGSLLIVVWFFLTAWELII